MQDNWAANKNFLEKCYNNKESFDTAEMYQALVKAYTS